MITFLQPILKMYGIPENKKKKAEETSVKISLTIYKSGVVNLPLTSFFQEKV